MTTACFFHIMKPVQFKEHGGIVRRFVQGLFVIVTGLIGPALPADGAGAPPPSAIVLVQGTVSAPNAAEQRFSRNTVRRISRWLANVGVPHAVVSDQDVIAGRLSGATVAVLCYNPFLPDKELRRLRELVGRGGNLIVFYSSDSRLAQMMGLRLGEYSAASAPGQWSAFRFAGPAPAGLPDRVVQESRNIRPVYPASAESAVIAWWENAQGKILQDPAWVKSPAGLWMSHVLLDDDAANKQQMLLAMIGSYEPSAWRAAADRWLAPSGNLGSFGSFEEAAAAIRRQAEQTGRQAEVGRLLAQAAPINAELRRQYAAQNWPAVVQAGKRLKEVISRAYASAQEAPGGEWRGVWDATGLGLYPGDWDRTCRLLAGRGMTAVLPITVRGATAYYDSKVLPAAEAVRLYGDQVAPCVAAAHRYGIQMHAWKICWNLDGAPLDLLNRFKAERRLQVSTSGESLSWLCTSHPANRETELKCIEELASRYPVDGIHLDYLRYPGADSCFCAGCRSRFETETGQKVRRWPRDADSGPLAQAYRQWRAQQMTEFVVRAAKRVRKLRPAVRMSAAVYGWYPNCIESIGQDWGSWLAGGHLDFVCPMNYTSDLNQFRSLTRRVLAAPRGKGQIYPGIGVTSSEASLDSLQTLEQILALRQEGVRGFALFSLNRTLEDEILPILSPGASEREGRP